MEDLGTCSPCFRADEDETGREWEAEGRGPGLGTACLQGVGLGVAPTLVGKVWMVLVFFSQMGAGQSFNSQFLQHSGPRGPSVPSSMNPASVGGLMGPSSMSPMGINPTRAAGMAPLYSGQRLPQQGYPGPPQAQPLPRQGVKRAYSGEVSSRASLLTRATRVVGCERTGRA